MANGFFKIENFKSDISIKQIAGFLLIVIFAFAVFYNTQKPDMHESEIARYNVQIDSLVNLVVKLDSNKITIIKNYNQINKTYNEQIKTILIISNDSNAELARATIARFRYLLYSE